MANEVMSPEDREKADVRETILRNRVMALTGSLDGDRALAEMYVGYDDEEKRRRVMEAYVKNGRSLDEAAKEFGVAQQTVYAWAFVGKWNQAVSMELAIRQEEEALQLARLRVRQRRDIVQKQLDSAQMVRDKVENELDNMSAKTAAEALKAAADIEARALGMSESGRTGFEDGGETASERKKDKDAKVPLVVVVQNASGSGIPVLGKKAEVINV